MSTSLFPPPPDDLPRRRLCLAADVEQYSRLDTRTQSAVQSELVRMLDEAAALAGLDRTTWTRQPQGDLEFAVLPDATQEDDVLGPFVHHLAVRLGDRNARPAAQRVRLRMAVDSGVVVDAALGHAGPAPVAVARYVNAPQLRAVLATLTAADLAVMVSDRLYQDVVCYGRWDLDPAQYVRAHVRVKEFSGYGWIRVPGHAPDDVRSAVAATPKPNPSSDTGAPSRTPLSQYVHQGAAVGRDVTGGLSIGLPVPPPPASSGPAR
ncbi:hypothetical protein [Streptomyces tsukubensis]|uniref:Uncharacterized protein n=1 Tax=Streptomyces tsukubensis TaxID=83656 RepID=A0A1V4A0U6_9ACTN|nr:hypothetical protein [Streptomyces tsukubensis]OON72446.1 hypothetical protein B1H18_29900 [Streptomyces tsukubensis]QFR96977.1 hypothetical protein GBW32_32925 [Streptomyces tsukubensis]